MCNRGIGKGLSDRTTVMVMHWATVITVVVLPMRHDMHYGIMASVCIALYIERVCMLPKIDYISVVPETIISLVVKWLLQGFAYLSDSNTFAHTHT